ncbi:MAG: minor capsid protein [Planctomycetia bacterium]|nr:minor capsid protein [Planctomycetia bacterium]
MSGDKHAKTVEELLFYFQTRLQGVANSLAVELGDIISSTDEKILKTILSEIKKTEPDIKKEMNRLKKLVKKLEIIRSETYDKAKAIAIRNGEKVADKAQTFEIQQSELDKRRKLFKTKLTKDQLSKVVNYQPIEGQSIAQWFDQIKKSDLNRITQAVQKASVEGLSVDGIIKAIRGTKEYHYKDGILETSKQSAQTLARTVINGVSNNARMELFAENADAIDGVQYLATLDGKTCPFCGSLDGKIWPPKEMGNVQRPPLHGNCRCCLVPYIEIKDKDGNILDLGTRPAANADFDKLAEENYNKQAKEKGWKKRYKDLSASTRLKYYYQTQKDFEERTGKPAYRQVSAGTSFKDYFDKQPKLFQRSWLGAKRFDAYNNGKLKFDQLVKPDTGYFVPINELGLKVNAPLVHSGSNLTSEQINENMAKEAENVFYELGKTGRKLGSGEKREKHIDVDGRSLSIHGEPNSSIDLYEDGVLKKRCFYDKNGNAEWEIDYVHQDARHTHVFPHVHVRFGTDRSNPIKHRERKNK